MSVRRRISFRFCSLAIAAEILVLGLPVTVLISRDGKICSKHVGMGNKDTFEREIKALL